MSKNKNKKEEVKVTEPITQTSDENKKPKRIIIKEAIERGGATKESLMEEANCNAKSLASHFSYLRLMGFFPAKDENGHYKLMTKDEWYKKKAESKAKAAPKRTPAQQLEALEKKVKQLQVKKDKFDKQKTQPDTIPDLQKQINNLMLKLALKQIETLKQK